MSIDVPDTLPLQNKWVIDMISCNSNGQKVLLNMHSNASHTVDGAQWFSPTKAELFHVLSGKTVVCFMGVG